MKPKPLEDMSKEELINLIKEVNGLVGAVDGDTLKHLRKFIQKYNELDWKYRNVKQAVQGLLEEIEQWAEQIDSEFENEYYRFGWKDALRFVNTRLIKKWLRLVD